ncbi:MAG TPA: hypothetical protein PK545_00720, partial [Deltaproteobacteria bacterium]|nr:hypothetical protein [Deltaproteobacteria bacterium]
QGPLGSHDAGAGTMTILGVTVVPGPNAEFHNAAGNASSREAMFGNMIEGVTVMKAVGTFTGSPPVLTADTIEMEPHL